MSASYRRTLTTGPFLRLLAGHGLATLGQLQLTMAVGVYVLARTDSGMWVSAAVVLGFAPYVLFSSTAGMLADRSRRSTVLRWSIGLRLATGSVATAGLLLQWPVQVVIALAALTAVVATPSYPALVAATPQTVRDVDLPAANSLGSGVENAAWVAGPGLLGLVLLTGAPVAGGGLAATACFGLALLCLGRTHTAMPERIAPVDESLTDEFLDGVRTIRADRRIRAALSLAVVDNFLYGYLVVAIVLLGSRTFDAGERGVGWLNSAFALGAIASMLVTPRLGGVGREPRVIVVTLTLFVAAAVGVAIAPDLVVALPLIFLAGMFTLIVEIVAVTLIQRLTHEAVTARVFGVYDTLAVAAIALGSALAGVLSEVVGVSGALGLACLITLVLTAALVPNLRSATLGAPVRPEPLRAAPDGG
ncbi:MAG: MFS transporter [Candidatus Nanopelagicales bacterium]|jgi:MFS family permease|nr:MFS transporter [Candidatus Nanopelagicales bacterium]